METKEKELEVSGKEITMSRLINAPVALVWEMFTNPEHIKHWWGPKGFTNTIYKMDVKPGGDWEFMMHGPDGRDYFNKHTYGEVIKHKKLVHVHGPSPKFELAITFEDLGNKTMLHIVSRFEKAEVLQKVIKEVNAAEGLKQNIDKLQAYIPTISAEKELVIMRQLNAPRELVWKAWTEAEGLAQWWGPAGMKMKTTNLDFRTGGSFHYCMAVPNGQEMWGKFDYKEIKAPEKIVFVNYFSNEKGEVVRAPMSDKWPLQVMNTLTFTEHEGKTTLLLKGGPINCTTEERAMFESAFDGMQQGFGGTFDQLEEYLAKHIK